MSLFEQFLGCISRLELVEAIFLKSSLVLMSFLQSSALNIGGSSGRGGGGTSGGGHHQDVYDLFPQLLAPLLAPFDSAQNTSETLIISNHLYE